MGWTLWPNIHPEYARAERDPAYYWRFHVPLVAVAVAATWLPPVRLASGADPLPFTVLAAAHLVAFGAHVRFALGESWPRAWPLLMATLNTVMIESLAISTGRPSSALWAFAVVYPLVAGSAFGLSAAALVVTAGVPVATAFAWDAQGTAPLPQALPALALVAAVASGVYVFVGRHRDLHLEANRLRREAAAAAAAAAERRRLADDLHTTLGAALSEIRMWQDLAGAGGAGADATHAALRRASSRTREALGSLRATVQGLAGDDVAIEVVECRLRSALGGLCAAASAALELEVRGPEVVPALRAYHAQKIAEEAALNAVRHGRARHVRVAVALGPAPHVEVADDGRGFDPQAAPAGHGREALAAHAGALGGRIEVVSAPGRGARVRLVPAEATPA